MGDVPTNVVAVRLRLLDAWGGDDVVRELSVAELETSERGIAIGSAFYPWRRVVSYEWDVVDASPNEAFTRPRQLLVRVLTKGSDGPEEHRVAADRFEVGPWSISMVVPGRVDTKTQRMVLRRITVPWHRVLEYERMLAEATIATSVPARPDVADMPELAHGPGHDASDDRPVVIDVAAADEAEAGRDDPARADDGTSARDEVVLVEDVEDAEDVEHEGEGDAVSAARGARAKRQAPREIVQRRRGRRPAS